MTEPDVVVLDRPGSTGPPPRRTVQRLLPGAVRAVVTVLVLAAVAAGGYFTRDQWMPVLFPAAPAEAAVEPAGHTDAGPSEQVMLSEQAQRNLNLTAKPLAAGEYWKTLSVPGMVIDRPGFSDRGVVAPATGVVSRIHRVAGDGVRPGDVLFTLKLLSESLHATQTDLFKAVQDIKVARAQRGRLAASGGAVPEARVIEVDAQIARLEVAVRAYRQDLLTRGLTADRVDAAAEGTFAVEVPILAPARPADPPPAGPVVASAPPSASAIPGAGVAALTAMRTPAAQPAAGPPQARPAGAGSAGESADAEVQEVKVELGQQVQAGQMLCLLANHRVLSVEGRAFRDEAPLIERTLREGWPVAVDFGEDRPDSPAPPAPAGQAEAGWGELGQTFTVATVANTIDPDTRTFRFLMPLENQSRTVDRGGRTQTLWRFRPGQRVRLLVRTERLDGVFVLPAEAVARDGADCYVFRQNGDTFDRKPVRVVYQDDRHAVVANDGSVPPGVYVAQTGAAQLNRMVKSQTGTTPKGFHVHADGSVHTGKH